MYATAGADTRGEAGRQLDRTTQAALRAPLGAYYRKPGYTAAEGPGSNTGTVEIGGLTYLYDQGVLACQVAE